MITEVQLTYRGITFNDTFTGDQIYMLQDVPEGLAHPSIRETEQNIQNQHGIIDANSWYGKRSMTLTGQIIASDEENRLIMERALQAVLQLDGIQREEGASYYQLLIEFEDELEVFCYAKVSAGVTFSKPSAQEPWRRAFITTLKAKDPRLYGTTLKSEALVEALSGTAFQLPTPLPFSLTSTTYFGETLTNDGNFAAPMVVTITGPTENPRLVNNTTGEVMQVNVTLEEGETLEIDTQLGTITKTDGDGNESDQSAQLADDSVLMQLAPGDNEIELRDDTDEAITASVDIEWRDTYMM